MEEQRVNWARFAYLVEFLFAIDVVYNVWAQAGGQWHLDLMPWFWKLGCGLSFSACVVGFTAAITQSEQFWTKRSQAWMAGIVVTLGLMAGLTAYYHSQESQDEPDSEETRACVAWIYSS